jgi:hypothetical protein
MVLQSKELNISTTRTVALFIQVNKSLLITVVLRKQNSNLKFTVEMAFQLATKVIAQ